MLAGVLWSDAANVLPPSSGLGSTGLRGNFTGPSITIVPSGMMPTSRISKPSDLETVDSTGKRDSELPTERKSVRESRHKTLLEVYR